MLKYFRNSFIIAAIGLIVAYFIGGVEAVWIAFILSVLEISLSFDNAIINAQVLKDMDAVWRHRFITWGMLIAVFGMRVIFPLIIVSVAIGISPIDAFLLAINSPSEYQHALESVHSSVMGFGGSFLMMVSMRFFIDTDKDIHWLNKIEHKLAKLGKIEAIQSAITLTFVYITYIVIDNAHGSVEASSFLVASIWGIISYILVDGLEAIIGDTSGSVVKSGLSGFLYLEVLDSSFSFDGVLAALSLTNNIFIIAIGLGVGALFVRSLTILLVEKGTVDEFIYLEHGAFYAIFGLSGIMFINTVYEISESITGLLGAAFIIASLISSIRARSSS